MRKRSKKNLMSCDEREGGGREKMELRPDGIETTNMLAIVFRPILKMTAVALERFKISKLISHYRR